MARSARVAFVSGTAKWEGTVAWAEVEVVEDWESSWEEEEALPRGRRREGEARRLPFGGRRGERDLMSR